MVRTKTIVPSGEGSASKGLLGTGRRKFSGVMILLYILVRIQVIQVDHLPKIKLPIPTLKKVGREEMYCSMIKDLLTSPQLTSYSTVKSRKLSSKIRNRTRITFINIVFRSPIQSNQARSKTTKKANKKDIHTEKANLSPFVDDI